MKIWFCLGSSVVVNMTIKGFVEESLELSFDIVNFHSILKREREKAKRKKEKKKKWYHPAELLKRGTEHRCMKAMSAGVCRQPGLQLKKARAAHTHLSTSVLTLHKELLRRLS